MRKFRPVLFIALIVVLAALGVAGYFFWYQPSYSFFNSNDASVTGSFVRVAAPASGQIHDLLADQGASVKKDDVLATIQVISAAPSGARLLAYVTSPMSGTLAVRNVSVGETIAAGQSIASIVDLNQLWVVVNVDESRVNEVRIGQTADVGIGDVNRTFRGKVVDIGSATTNVLAPSISLTSSSDSTQKVPVKVVFDYAGTRLVPGMSATVTIYTRETPQ
ncbi:MAG: efflux RND transporter periplasmic adaptor subunit [Anaerolineae bacterium]